MTTVNRKGVHGNQSVNFLGEGPSMIPVQGNSFDPGAYAHEAIALAEPFYPTCGPNRTCLHADEMKEIVDRLAAEADAAVETVEPTKSPFAVLKDLELSRKN